MKRTTLEGGVTVLTFDPPPENFDPFIATPAELQKYGLPAIPDDPRHRERYGNVFKQVKFVEPEFRVAPRRGEARGVGASPAGGPVGASSNWSGAVVYPPQGESFKWIQGEWVVPNVVAPGTWCISRVCIDGDSTGNVLSAGVQQSVGGKAVFVWFWVPSYPEFSIANISVSAGDRVSVVLCSNQGAGSTSSTAYFANLTTAQSTNFAVTLDGNAPFPAKSAEWLVASDWDPRSNLAAPVSDLADYGEVLFQSCEAVTTPGKITVNGGTGTGATINLVAGGELISEGILVDPTTVKCVYKPPSAPTPPRPVDCQSLLQNIDDKIGEGKHLPGETLDLWERELLACYTEGKITRYEYETAINLIHSRQP
jgi:Peptidase A4 family